MESFMQQKKKSIEFFENIYQSPMFTNGHKLAYNTGYHPVDPSIIISTNNFDHVAEKNDCFQLQMYNELLKMAPAKYRLNCDNGQAIQLLDIGCGAGGGDFFIQKCYSNVHVTGIDRSRNAIQICKHIVQKCKQENNKISMPNFVHGNVEHYLNFDENSFDIILCVQSFMLLQNVDSVLLQVRRVIKPGGLLLIADYHTPLHEENNLTKDYADAISILSRDGPLLGLNLLEQRDVSFNVAMAAKQNSSRMQKLIDLTIPFDLKEDVKSYSVLRKSKMYESLRMGEIKYFLHCFQYHQYDSLYDPLPQSILKHMKKYLHPPKSVLINDDIDDNDAPNYYDYKEIEPKLDILKTEIRVIVEELNHILTLNWSSWPEQHYSKSNSPQEWKVFPFCYTFPAIDEKNTKWVKSSCSLCPRTTKLLSSIPNLRTALFSRLGPNTSLTTHRGWADLANDVLRCHLGMKVPLDENGKDCCAMVVGKETKYHKEKEIIVFDDSKPHYAYNNSSHDRIILIVDILRPSHIPRGKARGGHTDELDAFIASYS